MVSLNKYYKIFIEVYPKRIDSAVKLFQQKSKLDRELGKQDVVNDKNIQLIKDLNSLIGKDHHLVYVGQYTTLRHFMWKLQKSYSHFLKTGGKINSENSQKLYRSIIVATQYTSHSLQELNSILNRQSKELHSILKSYDRYAENLANHNYALLTHRNLEHYLKLVDMQNTEVKKLGHMQDAVEKAIANSESELKYLKNHIKNLGKVETTVESLAYRDLVLLLRKTAMSSMGLLAASWLSGINDSSYNLKLAKRLQLLVKGISEIKAKGKDVEEAAVALKPV